MIRATLTDHRKCLPVTCRWTQHPTPGSVIEKFRITHIPDTSLEKSGKMNVHNILVQPLLVTNPSLCSSCIVAGGTTWVPPHTTTGSTVETYLASNPWNYCRENRTYQ